MELPAKLVTEILETLKQPPVELSYSGPRRSPRLEQEGTVLVTPWQCQQADAATSLSVTISNCSVHGIAILHCHPMTRGDHFVVRLMSKGRQTSAILCTVAHCRRINPQSFVIGAEFARLLPEGLSEAIPA